MMVGIDARSTDGFESLTQRQGNPPRVVERLRGSAIHDVDAKLPTLVPHSWGSPPSRKRAMASSCLTVTWEGAERRE